MISLTHRGAGQALVIALAALAMGVTAACGTTDDPTPTPTEDPRDHIQTPDSLQSYRWRVVVDATPELLATNEAPEGLGLDQATLHLEVEGARVNPDREWQHSLSTFGYLSLEKESIVIGDRNWSRQEAGPWREQSTLASPEDLMGANISLSPSIVLGSEDRVFLRELTDQAEGRPHTFETIDGRETRHWTFDSAFVEEVLVPNVKQNLPGVLTPEEVTVDMWVDMETNVAIRVEVHASTIRNADAFMLTMELYDINDPGIVVDQPEVSISR